MYEIEPPQFAVVEVIKWDVLLIMQAVVECAENYGCLMLFGEQFCWSFCVTKVRLDLDLRIQIISALILWKKNIQIVTQFLILKIFMLCTILLQIHESIKSTSHFAKSK